jgi:hypothetical protein
MVFSIWKFLRLGFDAYTDRTKRLIGLSLGLEFYDYPLTITPCSGEQARWLLLFALDTALFTHSCHWTINLFKMKGEE